jgi:hypothetical protein
MNKVFCQSCNRMVALGPFCDTCGRPLHHSTTQSQTAPQSRPYPQTSQPFTRQPYPTGYQQPTKKPMPTGLIFLGIGAIGVACFVILERAETSASPPATSTPSNKPADSAKSAQPTAPDQPSKIASTIEQSFIPIKELGSFQKDGKLWKVIQIPPNTKREDLIKLAKHLYKMNPVVSYDLYDDDKQIKAFLDFEKYNDIPMRYPRDPKYPFPEKWSTKHNIAMINKILTKGGAKWQLVPMPGGSQILESSVDLE